MFELSWCTPLLAAAWAGGRGQALGCSGRMAGALAALASRVRECRDAGARWDPYSQPSLQSLALSDQANRLCIC